MREGVEGVGSEKVYGGDGGADGVGGVGKKVEGKKLPEKVSFRDKVMGGAAMSFRLDDDLVGKKLGVLEWQNGDRLNPKVVFSEQAIQVLSLPWKDALVVRLLGKHISYTAMKEKLRSLWRLCGGYDVMDVGSGYFMVKFDLQEDRDKVIGGGPWLLNNHYLAVKSWTPSFSLNEASFGSTMIWIRLEGLNMLYYEERAISLIASAVGRPIRVDITTKTAGRGKFARVCVEIDRA